MSSLTHNDIAEMVRRRFNGPPEDALRYVPLVDPALRDLAYEVAADPSLRNWLLTDPATTVTGLSDGVADLSALIDPPTRILLECLKYGEILPPTGVTPTLPLRMLESEGQGQLKGMFDSLQGKYWLEGFFIHTKRKNGVYMAGDLRLRVPYWPTLGQLPEALVHKLVHGNYWQANTPEKNAA